MTRRGAPLLLLIGLAGCGLSPIGGNGDIDITTTGSIAPTPANGPLPLALSPMRPPVRTAVDGVAPKDWDRIRLIASTSFPGTANGQILDWANPDTGSNGTITPVANAKNEADSKICRAFALTVSDIRGIRRYSGDACRTPDGMWQLFDVTPFDHALL